MYNLGRIKNIVDYMPSDYTGCMICQDIIYTALKKGWSNHIFESGQYLQFNPEDYSTVLTGIKSFRIQRDIVEEVIYPPKDSRYLSTACHYLLSDLTPGLIIELIRYKVRKHGVVSVDVEAIPQHSFVLVNTRDNVYILDAYANYRPSQYRKFNFNKFFDLIVAPSEQKWNHLFLAKEKVDKNIWFHFCITIRY